MSENITYLLGAGASFNALPMSARLYNEDGSRKSDSFGNKILSLDERIQFLPKKHKSMDMTNFQYEIYASYEFIDPYSWRRTGEEDMSLIHDQEYEGLNQVILNEILDDFEWLANESKDFQNIDTLAKYYYARSTVKNGDKERFNRLKRALVFFFVFEQKFLFGGRKDTRYLNFLVSILSNLRNHPTNINFISWNYDYQLQLADYKIGDGLPTLNHYPGLGEKEDAQLVHMNGIAGQYIKKNGEHSNLMLHDIHEVLRAYMSIKDGSDTIKLRFAWEDESDDKTLLNKQLEIAKNLLENTRYLVVIGYSFPFYNREIDNDLMYAFTEENEFAGYNKIFFQDPVNDGSFISDRFDFPLDRIEHIDSGAAFHIPVDFKFED